jgi:hypothetical protein
VRLERGDLVTKGRHVLLEDSLVLEVALSEHQIAFRIEAVLLPEHQAYTDLKPGEMHCCRSGWLSFSNSQAVVVELSGAPPAIDASGATDLGHIDGVNEVENDMWVLEGDWGQATVRAPRVDLLFD